MARQRTQVHIFAEKAVHNAVAQLLQRGGRVHAYVRPSGVAACPSTNTPQLPHSAGRERRGSCGDAAYALVFREDRTARSDAVSARKVRRQRSTSAWHAAMRSTNSLFCMMRQSGRRGRSGMGLCRTFTTERARAHMHPCSLVIGQLRPHMPLFEVPLQLGMTASPSRVCAGSSQAGAASMVNSRAGPVAGSASLQRPPAVLCPSPPSQASCVFAHFPVGADRGCIVGAPGSLSPP